MLRNFWIAVGGILWSASLVLGQVPGMAPPYGYPGYPMPPMNPAMPPYGAPPMNPAMPPYGMPPMNPSPYGYPTPYGMLASRPMPYAGPTTPIPPDPRRPMPVHDEAGPRKGATEPYLVAPEKTPAAPPANTLPPAAPKAVVATPAGTAQVCESPADFAELGPIGPPAEPYTLYEGRRYLAEVKNDCTCVFGSVSYIHWWTRRDQTVPLATTGPAANPAAGTLGDPTTTVLLGGGQVAPHEFSGIQATLGIWLDPEHLTSLEFGGFYLGKNSRQYAFGSDGTGFPVVTRPIAIIPPGGGNLAEGVHIVAAPGVATGNVNINSIMNLLGTEANIGRNLTRLNGFSMDYLVGIRYLYLNDSLTITESSTLLPGGALSFLGVPQPAGTTFNFYDSFNVTNRFFGGQLGLRLNYIHCTGFDIGGTFKLALGDTMTTYNIDGSTSVGANTAPGGVIAQPSNIGNQTTHAFSVIPEATCTVGYQVHPNIRLFTGYTLLYWNRVARAGEQIDRAISPGQSPTDPAFAAGAVGNNPRFLNSRSDFWAQGLNVGIEVKY